MNLFLDTNTLLSFYHFSSDDLEELRKLAVLLREGRVILYVPTQVISEFRRNREVKIADALKQLRDQKLNLQFPQLSKDYKEYERLRSLQREYSETHGELLTKIERDVEAKLLKADDVINELIALATHIPCDDEILARARSRHQLGNPPGKRDSIGDAVNWEALVVRVRGEEDLYFVSADRDFSSPLDAERFNEYLALEWEDNKGGEIRFFKRLSGFLNEQYPDIKLAEELEKDLLIRSLAASGTFKRTHDVVARLSKYSDFTPAQAAAIVTAAVNNTQISWIAKDEDVQTFLLGVRDKRADSLDEDLLRELDVLLLDDDEKEVEEEEDELPF
jgi:hypothetical protein